MIPSLFILVPFVCVLFLNMPFKALMNRLVSWVGIAVCLLQIIFILFIEPSLLHTRFFSGLAFFKFDLLLDNLGNFMLLSIGIVMLIAFLMAKALESDLEYRFSFMNIMLIMLIGLNGIVLVKGIFSLYVFLEITAATSFILISFF